MDLIDEQLEFLNDMAYLEKLEGRIFWALQSTDAATDRRVWDDIHVYGNEPIFASLFFERAIAEAERDAD